MLADRGTEDPGVESGWAPPDPPAWHVARQRRRPRRTTLAAAAILAGTAAVAVGVSASESRGQAAATIDATTISASTVAREVSAIEAQPIYERALANANTLALSAPVSPTAVAAASGDPDDLRISLVPVGGASLTRSYTTSDLRAAVLTRLLYLAALEQVLAAHHVVPDAGELADGIEQARQDAGYAASGASLYDRLPSWYRDALAHRGADAEALQRWLVGAGGITPTEVQAAYDRRLATDFTSVCLRVLVVPAPQAATARAQLSSDPAAGRDAGCAPISGWAPDVGAAIRSTPVGVLGSPVDRGSKVALLRVTGRTVQPLGAVYGNVWAQLSARYADSVNSVVEDQLALDRVTVAPAFGIYQALGPEHGVLPPDALTPPATPGQPTTPVTSPRQQLDPFS